jgi:hypothetical protein
MLPVNGRSSLWYLPVAGKVERWDLKKANEGKEVEQLLKLGPFVHSFIQSISSLPYDRSTAPSTASSPHNAI